MNKTSDNIEFNSAQQALMGISSGAYLALKTNENKTTPVPKVTIPKITTENTNS